MLFDDTYKTIAAGTEGTYKEKGSRFLAFAIPCSSETEVKDALKSLKKKYFDASHHCYAYQLGSDKSAQRMNDDGEPSGTAGRPIFGQILSHDLTNILIVVVRYYGGTKLGVSGLINAYRTAACDALSKAEMLEKIVCDHYQIDYPYERMNDVMGIIKEMDLNIIKADYNLACSITVSVRRMSSPQLEENLTKKSILKFRYLLSR